MNRVTFNNLRDDFYKSIVDINKKKGNDYAGDEDAFRNFKEVAERSGLTPSQVWSVYFHKHMMAIETFIRDGKVESEAIEERIKDAILYLFLLHGMIQESHEIVWKDNP